MKSHPMDRLLRSLNRELSEEEENTLRRDLAASPVLRQQREELASMQQALRHTVHAASEHAVKPFLSDRVLRRLRAERLPKVREEEMIRSLLGMFRPVALACLVVILALAAYNVTINPYDVKQSATEAVLGLPPIAVVVAYDVELQSGTVEP